MNYYTLELLGETRRLPLVAISSKRRVASFNILGDEKLVSKAGRALAKKVHKLKFDLLIGPEVKVVPLLQVMAGVLKQPRYIVCRKSIKGYMVHPRTSPEKPILVLDGRDAELIFGKRLLIVDDVVSTGRTITVLKELVESLNGKIVGAAAILRQGEDFLADFPNFFCLGQLPVFT
jgi:adenine phosphoribosyltransferase